MGKYSSDSDNEKRIKSSYKSRPKRRSSSSSSSESRSRKYKRNRSRSRDRYSRSSSSTHKSKSRRSSRSKNRSRYRDRTSDSRAKHRRSRSRSYIREYSSKPRRRSSSSDSEPKHEGGVSEIGRKSPEMSKVDHKTLSAINEDGFTPKSFTSTKSKKMMDNIVIDLKKQTIKVPEVELVEPDSIFHHNLFLNEEARMEKWIKELYGYRQKALQQGLKTCEK